MAYTTEAEVRALKPLDDASKFSGAMIAEAIEWATVRIDEETGTSWELKTHTVSVNGNGLDRIWTGIPFLRSVTAVSVDGVAETIDDTWKVSVDGYVIRPSGVYTSGDLNVSVTVTAGATTVAPEDIQWAARTLARWYLLRLVSVVPDNSIQVVTEGGTVMLAQPGKYGPTSIPEVNTVLARRNHRAPSFG